MRRLKQLEEENGKLRKLVADLSLDRAMLQDVLAKKLDPAPKVHSFMSRACSPFAPTRGGLQRLLG